MTATNTTWESLNGVMVGEPSLAARDSTHLDIFVRGGDNACYHKAWDGSAWSANWESLGGLLASDPVTVSLGPDRLDVFCRGVGGEVFRKSWDGKSWSPSASWENLQGNTVGRPAVVTLGNGRIEVFANTQSQGIWRRTFDNNKWSDWTNIGDPAKGDPTAVVSGPDRIDVFILGNDGSPKQKTIQGGTVTPTGGTYTSLGGSSQGIPVPVSSDTNHVNLFVYDVAGSIYENAFSGSWAGWTFHAGKSISAPNAVSQKKGSIDVFYQGTDNQVYRSTYDGSTWSPATTAWNSIGGNVASRPVPAPGNFQSLWVFGRGAKGDAVLWRE